MQVAGWGEHRGYTGGDCPEHACLEWCMRIQSTHSEHSWTGGGRFLSPFSTGTHSPTAYRTLKVLDAASDERSCRLKAALRFGAGPVSVEAHMPSVASSFVHCPRTLSGAEVI